MTAGAAGEKTTQVDDFTDVKDPNGVDDFTLASLMCSKLCHDLVSPAGAMANGLEVLISEDDPMMRDQVMSLLAQSASQVSSRLQFFRMAFGAGGQMGDSIDTGEVARVLRDYVADKKVELDWGMIEPVLPKRQVRLILACALIASEALVRGGTVRVEKAPEGDGDFRILAGGDRLILQQPIINIIENRADDQVSEPRYAAALLARRLAREAGLKVRVEQPDETRVVFCW